jgi:DNA-binding GntR family transcriptional regulator
MAQHAGRSIVSSDQADLEQVVLDKLRPGQRFSVEELLDQLPEVSWSQLFLAIDVLSRRGDIELRRQGFTYTVMKARTSMDGSEGRRWHVAF